MSTRTREIAQLKAIFDNARNAERWDCGELSNAIVHEELGHALIDVGKKKYYELKEEIFPYLNDPNSDYRYYAVKTLGGNLYLHLPEFKDKAYEIFLHDPDMEVKAEALSVWVDYYVASKEPKVLQVLYDIIISDKYELNFKANVICYFYMVANAFNSPKEGPELLSLWRSDDNENKIKAAIDIPRLNAIMKKYVPDWQQSN